MIEGKRKKQKKIKIKLLKIAIGILHVTFTKFGHMLSIYVLFCKYFAAISVASSAQVTLQFYFQIFYSTAPNKIVIKLTKLKNTNC